MFVFIWPCTVLVTPVLKFCQMYVSISNVRNLTQLTFSCMLLLPLSVDGVFRSFIVIAAPVEMQLCQLVNSILIRTTGDGQGSGITWSKHDCKIL